MSWSSLFRSLQEDLFDSCPLIPFNLLSMGCVSAEFCGTKEKRSCAPALSHPGKYSHLLLCRVVPRDPHTILSEVPTIPKALRELIRRGWLCLQPSSWARTGLECPAMRCPDGVCPPTPAEPGPRGRMPLTTPVGTSSPKEDSSSFLVLPQVCVWAPDAVGPWAQRPWCHARTPGHTAGPSQPREERWWATPWSQSSAQRPSWKTPRQRSHIYFAVKLPLNRVWIHTFSIQLRILLRWETTFDPSRETAASFWVGGCGTGRSFDIQEIQGHSCLLFWEG